MAEENSTRALELTQDPSTVYYIHPSDNNNYKFISEIFDGENYSSWKRSMVIGLSTKNKMCFVDGSLPKPSSEHNTYKAWVRCNNLVAGWILGVLGPVTKKSVFFYKTAREMWKDLEERYGHISSTQLYALQEEINEVQQESDDIAEYFAKLKVLWDELDEINPLPVCECDGCTCNLTSKFLKIQQDQRLLRFLMKLKDSYKQIRSNILMMHPLPQMTVAYRMLLQEQKQKQISELGSSHESMVFGADRRRFFDNKPRFLSGQNNGGGYNQNNNYYNQGNRNVGGNNQYNGRQNDGYKRNLNLFCTHCKMSGHTWIDASRYMVILLSLSLEIRENLLTWLKVKKISLQKSVEQLQPLSQKNNILGY